MTKQQMTPKLKAALSLSWYGYNTTKEIPAIAYDIWETLSPEVKNIFIRLFHPTTPSQD